MVRGFRLAAVLCAAALIGNVSAQEQPGGHDPAPEPVPAPDQDKGKKKPCTCTIKAAFGNGKSAVDGVVNFKIPIRGKVTTAPKDSKETVDPIVSIDAFFVYRVEGGKWQRVPLETAYVNVAGDGQTLACGTNKDPFEREVSWGDIAVKAEFGKPAEIEKGKRVDCEVHLFATSTKCKMDPVKSYVTFSYKKGEKPGTDDDKAVVTVSAYSEAQVEIGGQKKKALISRISKYGWLLDPPATLVAPPQ